MRASSITHLLATGLWAVVACSGSGGGNGPSGQAGPLQNGSYQKPSSSYEDPPSTSQPSDYEKPPSIYEGGGSSAPPAPTPGADFPCEALCAMAESQDCADELDNSDSPAALPYAPCVELCRAELVGYACPDDLANLSTCIVDNVDELNCRQLEQIGNGNPNNIPQDARDACTDRIATLVDCLENGDNPDPGTGGSCTLAGRCICDGDCASCRCENLGDDGPCEACRNNN
jgi:hypothetical protein